MKNSTDQAGCYPLRPKDEVDNTLRDLQNSSYPTKTKLLYYLFTKTELLYYLLQMFSNSQRTN